MGKNVSPMGLGWQLQGIAVTPLSFRDDRHPFGTRVVPKLELDLKGFFVHGGVEIGLSRFENSSSGVAHFDTDPTFYYSGNLGYRSPSGWSLRVGRSHYEESDIEGVLTQDSYQVSPTFANVTVPLGWAGGALRYDGPGPEGRGLENISAGIAYQRGDDGTHLGIVQGLLDFHLGHADGQASSVLTLAANSSVRSKSAPDSGSFAGRGTTWGLGGLLHYSYKGFRIATSFHRSAGRFEDQVSDLNFVERRHALTALMGVAPGKFLLQGVYTFTQQLQETQFPAMSSVLSEKEHHLEGQVGYRPVEGLLLSLGYRGVLCEDKSQREHFAFLGLLMDFGGFVEFKKKNKQKNLGAE